MSGTRSYLIVTTTLPRGWMRALSSTAASTFNAGTVAGTVAFAVFVSCVGVTVPHCCGMGNWPSLAATLVLLHTYTFSLLLANPSQYPVLAAASARGQ